MRDQHTVYNSRMFCTRWNGLEKVDCSEISIQFVSIFLPDLLDHLIHICT